MKRRLALPALTLFLCLTIASSDAQEKTSTSDGQKSGSLTATARTDVQTYRLTFTVVETDAGKKVGLQHFAVTVVPGGQSASVRLGSKVPANNTYYDVGLNIFSRLQERANGMEASVSFDQSALVVSDSGSPGGPVIRQARLESIATLSPGKPVVLGSVDIPGSTRHLEIEVVMDRVM